MATLQRNPKMELSRTDLLRLMSILEGELQAREVVIAVLKAEQVKKLLYPNKSISHAHQSQTIQQQQQPAGTATMIPNHKLNKSSNGLSIDPNSSDPFAALTRDACGAFDPSFDEMAIKTVYNLQLRQLDNLVDRQRSIRSYMRSQLEGVNSKYNEVFQDLEIEREKSRYFEEEKVLNKVHTLELEKAKLEKQVEELKSLAEKEREREKKMIICLLAERKQLIIKLIEEKQKNSELVNMLTSEKNKTADMVEGLEEESKRSLQMELDLERLQGEFELQKDQLRDMLTASETRNLELTTELTSLQQELELLKSSKLLPDLGEGVRSAIVTISSNVVSGHRGMPTVSSITTVSPPKANVARPLSPTKAPVVCSSVKQNPVPARPVAAVSTGTYATVQPITKPTSNLVSPLPTCIPPPPSSAPPAPPPKSPATGKLINQMQGNQGSTAFQNMTYNMEVNPSSGQSSSNKLITTPGKILVQVQGNTTQSHPQPQQIFVQKKPIATPPSISANRGAPPPVPPNKPVLPPSALKERSKELQQASAVAARTKLVNNSTGCTTSKGSTPLVGGSPGNMELKQGIHNQDSVK